MYVKIQNSSKKFIKMKNELESISVELKAMSDTSPINVAVSSMSLLLKVSNKLEEDKYIVRKILDIVKGTGMWDDYMVQITFVQYLNKGEHGI